MPKLLFAAVSVAGALVLLACAGPVAATEHASRFSDGEVEEIERIVRDYLLRNPSVMRDVLTALEAEEEARKKERLVSTIASNREELLNSSMDAVLGNPEGDVTLVEFFDYNCGFCKRALSDLDELLRSDPQLRVALKEFPILTRGSVEAARVSMAAARQPKFWDFHRALLGSKGAANSQKALRVAAEAGLDMDRLRKDMSDPSIDQAIVSTQKLASQLGVEGTPAYIVGTTLVPGAVGVEGLREAIEEARGAN